MTAEPMDLEKNQQKEELIKKSLEEVKTISDLWLCKPEPSNILFLWLYRFVSILVIVIQFMVLGALIYDNVSLAPNHDMSFQIVASRLFIVLYLAANLADTVSPDILGIFSLAHMFDGELDYSELSCGMSSEIGFLIFLILQGFYLALGIPTLAILLLKAISEWKIPYELTFTQFIMVLLLGIYEWFLLVLVLIASVAVVIIQTDAVSCLFNFLGVIVVMQLDDVLLKLVHFQVEKLEQLQPKPISLAAAKLSIAGFVGVVTFIYCFIITTK